MTVEQAKFITRLKSGKLVKVPVVMQHTETRIEFLKSDFALKDEIKSMQGPKWHGFDSENPRKIWSVDNSPRNRFHIGFLKGENVYEWFDRPLIRHEYDRPLMDHQRDLSDHGLTYHYSIWAAEMGCIDGDAVVHVNRRGKGLSMTLRELCYKWRGGETRGRAWDLSHQTQIRGYVGGRLGLIPVKKVLFKGVKPTLTLILNNGKSIRLTHDHEVCVGLFRYGKFKRADELKVGDTIIVAAPDGARLSDPAMPQKPPAKLQKVTKLGLSCWLDKDGYVRVGGLKGHPRHATHGVYEHLLVMEELIGRPVQLHEEVHHINHQRWDNRPENLMLCSDRSEHMREHNCVVNLERGKNAAHTCVVADKVVDIVESGETDVYDVMCEGPYHNFVANGVVVSNCGKTLSAIEVIEKSGVKHWLWVGPKSSLPAIKREFKKWNLDPSIEVEMMTYEALARLMDKWPRDKKPPQGVIFDECSRLKTETSQRSRAAQKLGDLIRCHYGYDGYVIEMSGTPAPKRPTDWWSLAEIAWPGFLREGSVPALERRLAFMTTMKTDAGSFKKRAGWKDDENKCAICGEHADHPCHQPEDYFNDILGTEELDRHDFEASVNEVAYMYKRLRGLVVIKHKKDCLDLPEKQYRVVHCKPSASTLRAAKVISQSAPNTVTGLTLLRELSDGFQYREKQNGMSRCAHCDGTGTVGEWFDPNDDERTFLDVQMFDEEFTATLQKRDVECPKCHGAGEVPKMVRITKEVPCPKEQALKDLLEENEEQGRIVVFAGFTGSVDRVVRIVSKEGWSVVRCDGRGFAVYEKGKEVRDHGYDHPLDYWADTDKNTRVAFVAHPESGGMSLTLTEARMAVYWSNSFKPEYRTQSEDRIHRKGMDENLGATIVDLIHLPFDERVLEVLRENRRLELLTLGEFTADLAA